MSERPPASLLRAVLAGLLVALLGGACALSRIDGLAASRKRLEAASVPLYVPSGRAAKLLSLGHASTAADILYLWSIQHFSEPAVDPVERSAWLQRVYGTITDLDPRFRDAYWLGYVSLLIEGKDLDAALKLVDKALGHDPDFTLLAVEAAIAARKAGRIEASVHYLDVGCATGDKLACRLLLRVREAETAQDELQAWREMEADEDGLTRYIAGTHVRDLTMMITAAQLSALVDCYAREHRGMAPGSLDQLVAARYLQEIPLDPDGRPYAYDVRTGAVTPASPYRYRPPSNSRLGVDLSSLGRCAPPQWRAP